MSDLNLLGRPRRTAGPSPSLAPVAGLSIYDSIYLGTHQEGHRAEVGLMYRNMLLAGEPGSGKSVALNNIVAHAALCADVELVLIDGKLVELLPWAPIADAFVGNDPQHCLATLMRVQREMENRYDVLAKTGRRKIMTADGLSAVMVVIDELAYFSVTVGDEKTRAAFITLVRDLVARGRAAGVIVVAATQRPSADIIPTSLRDLFGYRVAFRCTTDSSSDIILGQGWAKEGHSAKKILPTDLGVGLLLAEGGTPARIKTANLTDEHIQLLVERAAWLRGTTGGGSE
jgi:S-DNA-T family DNA segregation ATPase FtsK/SpoIIIE